MVTPRISLATTEEEAFQERADMLMKRIDWVVARSFERGANPPPPPEPFPFNIGSFAVNLVLTDYAVTEIAAALKGHAT
jgi:hypothetical protein